jgi:hypothetical protein
MGNGYLGAGAGCATPTYAQDCAARESYVYAERNTARNALDILTASLATLLDRLGPVVRSDAIQCAEKDAPTPCIGVPIADDFANLARDIRRLTNAVQETTNRLEI